MFSGFFASAIAALLATLVLIAVMIKTTRYRVAQKARAAPLPMPPLRLRRTLVVVAAGLAAGLLTMMASADDRVAGLADAPAGLLMMAMSMLFRSIGYATQPVAVLDERQRAAADKAFRLAYQTVAITAIVAATGAFFFTMVRAGVARRPFDGVTLSLHSGLFWVFLLGFGLPSLPDAMLVWSEPEGA